ncbi:MAG: hypothetical protein HYU66_04610 [Armatimonadetes bacterium]|nr:hypothetical protein [Armatimonadota bacterium]
MRCLAALLALCCAAAHADEVIQGAAGRFVISSAHGNLVSAERRVPVLAACLDEYVQLTDAGEQRATETDDTVTRVTRQAGTVVFTCRNPKLDLIVTKTWQLTAGGLALAKTIETAPLTWRGELRVRSVLRLAEGYRAGAFYYTPRQSWGASPQTELFGVRPASAFVQPVVSGSGWDNRFVVAFKPGAPAVGHYRWAVRGEHVMPSAVMASWGRTSPFALTYTPDGWSFQLYHTLDGERAPVSATAHYRITPGDFLDVWRQYRAQPEHRRWEDLPVPAWATRSEVGGFWHPGGDNDAGQLKQAHETADKLAGRSLPMGVFAWCLDGDYETEKPFPTEPGSAILTPDYLRTRIAEMQKHPGVKLGLYFQGALIEALTEAYRRHPEWALQDAAGKPVDSGFKDNPAGAMYWFNPLDEGWRAHYRRRLEAVCRAYDPGWIYCDGGAACEATDYRMRRPILSDDWNRFYRAQQDTVHATGPDRAVLLNSQCWPYGDMYWLECGYFDPNGPWRQAMEFCFDTKLLHTPQRTMLPLYWSNNDKYLGLCVAFGFTPTTSGGQVGPFDDNVWRAIECAYQMRRASLILSSRATEPVWWRDGTPVVCFAERVGESVVVPVFNFGDDERVTVTVDCHEAGVPESVKAQVVHPFERGQDKDLGVLKAAGGKLRFDVAVPKGFGGLRLIVLGEKGAGW